ncbi:MAG: hypothetical protein ACRD4Y_01950 [Candidatus Acidiferrales bacterium]
MKVRSLGVCLLMLAAALTVRAQEAVSGFELRATTSGEALISPQLSYDRNDWKATGAFRAVLYPTWKIGENWTVTGSVQASSYPYFFADVGSSQKGMEVELLQANVSYSHFWGNRSVLIRVGQLSSAFGSFALRYDDSVNPLIDTPQTYGYFGNGVSLESLAGGEVDATLGRIDLRGQLTNSSPSNPQSLASHDQHLNWTVGGGYTLVQGLRIGGSVYRGPYWDDVVPANVSEASPAKLLATGVGADLEWGYGHWNVNAEWQRFQMDEFEMPASVLEAGYGEARVVVSPRIYLAARLGTVSPDRWAPWETYEAAVGYRPGAHELLKVEYEIQQGRTGYGAGHGILAIQFVTTLRLFSTGRS